MNVILEGRGESTGWSSKLDTLRKLRKESTTAKDMELVRPDKRRINFGGTWRWCSDSYWGR